MTDTKGKLTEYKREWARKNTARRKAEKAELLATRLLKRLEVQSETPPEVVIKDFLLENCKSSL